MDQKPTSDGRLTFLKTELETGMTFAAIAEDATDEEKIARNYRNAMKAYDSIRHFISKMLLTKNESSDLMKGVKALGKRLERLREEISR